MTPFPASSIFADRDLPAVAASARRLPLLSDLGARTLEPMPVKGIAHDHIRLRGKCIVLRIPRLSQFGMAPHENLTYQAACFARAEPSGATPRLYGVLEPDHALPFGALAVEEIRGRPPRLPADLPGLAVSLARVHRLPVPAANGRPPLQNHHNPVGAMVALIERQSVYLEQAEIAPASLGQIEEEIDWARRFAERHRGEPQPVTLVVTDTQPGNFLIEAEGRAVAVDLEKMVYGSPAVDLAHATLYTSTRWDPEVCCELEPADVRRFEGQWLEAAGSELAAGVERWLAPMRRLTWLRSTTFFMKWLVESAGTGNWSSERLGPELASHVRRHVLDCLEPGTIERIRATFAD